MEDITVLFAERYLDVKTTARLKRACRHLNACITEQVLHHALASSLWRKHKEKALLFLWRELSDFHNLQPAPEQVARLVAVNKLLVVWGASAETPYQVPLKGAAAVGSVEAVKMLMDRGAKVIGKEEVPGEDYDSKWGFYWWDLGEFRYGRAKDALWYAAKNGHYDVVKVLLDREIDAAEKTTSRVCYQAARKGWVDILERLLSRRPNPHRRTLRYLFKGGVRGGHVGVLRMLVDRGAPVRFRQPEWVFLGYRAMVYAARFGHRDVVNLFLTLCRRKGSAQWGCLLQLVVDNAWEEVITFLLEERKSNINEFGIHESSDTESDDDDSDDHGSRDDHETSDDQSSDVGSTYYSSDDESVEEESSGDTHDESSDAEPTHQATIEEDPLDDDSKTDLGSLLLNAVKARSPRILKLLLSHGANPTYNNSEALSSAGFAGDTGMVQLLLDKGANASHALLPTVKATGDRRGILTQLLTGGANPRTGDNEAVRCAVALNKVEDVRAFVDVGVDAADILIEAARRGHVGILDLVCDNVPEDVLHVAFKLAFVNRKVDAVRYLLEKGASADRASEKEMGWAEEDCPELMELVRMYRSPVSRGRESDNCIDTALLRKWLWSVVTGHFVGVGWGWAKTVGSS
ncbi:hypothetical protein HK104_007650 [Borealophlyctis nickersoniae]|nr:hypothetical protein HK104_007650 [Borealophlyctis nickersoniae]